MVHKQWNKTSSEGLVSEGQSECVLTSLPFLRVVNTHPKLVCACVHAAANHEAITWLKNVQGTRHSGVSHGTHKNRHILCQAATRRRERDHCKSSANGVSD